MSLQRYRGKRDFRRTPEPAGAPADSPTAADAPTPARPRFVVQRHRARRLHYDFRLEMAGVLASWAVPKGPTLDPSVRRAAVHVEDHPVEYLHFEGVIPAGQYGGGDVIVWDTGGYEPAGGADPAAAVAAGELHVDLFGEKLRGRFVLVRSGGDGRRREQWLLLHKHDDFAVPGWDPEEHPRSVLSGRTNDEVAADPDRMWRSDLPAVDASVPLRPAPASEEELDQLDALGAAGSWQLFGRTLRVTNLDKVLFPGRPGQPPVTKREFLRYTARIAPVLLPYLTGRPLTMHRYPNGAGTAGFWHKQLPDHAPSWLARWTNPEADPAETATYLLVNEPAALVWAANFGALEWHPWTSRAAAPREPTYALVDIDPGPATSWADVILLAKVHRDALQHLAVTGVPKLTGQRGIQVWIPVAAPASFDETRAWVEQLSRAVGAVLPELVSFTWDVRGRGGLARLDYTQNAINKTLVAPYSPRPAAGAPVSAPISWDELDDPDLAPDRFTIRTVLDRVAERGDLFRPVLGPGQRLPGIR